MGTISGKRIDLTVAPAIDQISLDDIAHALGNQCRYTGHVREHYSVAEHCLWVASLVPHEFKLAALLHDAQEAYIGDMSTPLKHEIGGGGYHQVEQRIVETLDRCFEMDGQLIHLHDCVKLADRRMLMSERDTLIDRYDDWGAEFERVPRHPNFKPMYLDNPAGARDAYYNAVKYELVRRNAERD